jgi:hypothetical protein
METVMDSQATTSNPTGRRPLVTPADQQAAQICQQAGVTAADVADAAIALPALAPLAEAMKAMEDLAAMDSAR